MGNSCENVITGKDKNRSVSNESKSGEYNYSPDFKKSNGSDKIKFLKYLNKIKFILLKINISLFQFQNIDLNDIQSLLKDKDILRNENIDDLKNKIRK